MIILKDIPTLYNPNNYCNKSNNQKNVYDASDIVADKTDSPSDNEDHGY